MSSETSTELEPKSVERVARQLELFADEPSDGELSESETCTVCGVRRFVYGVEGEHVCELCARRY